MELKELVWNDFNSKHILKHKVNKTETEEACNNRKLVLSAKNKRLLLIGKTKKGRILSIVLDKIKPSKYYIVTARDSSKKERRLISDQK
ncbi:BrnT family toxin [Patescibacteria group bacterium]|nr:BrnT family toxin [Patescibacteria group bacterium]